MPEHTPAPTPHRAVYGFAFYLLFLTLFIMYVLWALLPTEELGLTYLPDKYFAVFLPMVVLVGLFFFVFFIYPAINFSLTADVDALATIVDSSIRRDGVKKNCFWEELKTANMPTKVPKKADIVKNCAYCHETHRPTKLKQIGTLRFMDLSEMNRAVFK